MSTETGLGWATFKSGLLGVGEVLINASKERDERLVNSGRPDLDATKKEWCLETDGLLWDTTNDPAVCRR